ncbi:MAG: DUF4038 domain-containing protein [Cyclobacteriaceae bacterium]|jgi:hypothetical protein
MKPKSIFYLTLMSLFLIQCKINEPSPWEIQQWKETEIVFTSGSEYDNPYTDVDIWVEFTGPDNQKIVRPGYWEKNNTWKVRFACPTDHGEWTWESFSSNESDSGLHGKKGILKAVEYTGYNPLIKNGLLRMSPGKRNVIHANGKLFLMIGDTPWALPWRGTYESVEVYASNRQKRGFNTALLMSLMPDRGVDGPRSRSESGGFEVAFEDLKDGHINEVNTEYFLYLDSLQNILINHGIVPVFQPVFHGFGWKGKNLLGWDVDEKEYARYCRYLVARYGAEPAMWLIGADSDGRNKGIKEGGEEVEKWDAYKQPTGLHYSPFDDKKPDWMEEDGEKYEPHMNRTHQDADWLDFQWCQTGHGAEHQFHKVALMYKNKPTKAVANGEPTYEGINNPENGAGWWQGHEAWSQFLSGGTMGVVYGAGGLWNWKLSPEEEGWPAWANSKVSWREAIDLPGAVYVGYFGKALEDLDITDIEKHPELADGELCLAKPHELFIIYLPEGGSVIVNQIPENGTYTWFDPREGIFVSEGKTNSGKVKFTSPLDDSSVLLIQKNK